MNITPISAAHPKCSGVDCGRRAACSRYVGSLTEPADLASCVGGLLFNPRHQRASTACLACKHGQARGLDVVCLSPRLSMRSVGETVHVIRDHGGECGPRADLMESRS